MNSGKICVSICAADPGELIGRVKDAPAGADLIEVRLDCLDGAAAAGALSEIPTLEPAILRKLLLTLRPPEHGGKRPVSLQEREKTWQSSIDRFVWGIDLEEDICGSVGGLDAVRICSFHHFEGAVPDLNVVYDKLAASGADILKIAVHAPDACDAAAVWKLLERARAEGRKIIPIAMGEAGKWTRILGPAHGSFLTFAAPSAGGETAPGQLTADDLLDLYRVKELGTATDVYGLIAGNTSYSISPYLHNTAFHSAGADAVFVPFQIKDLSAFFRKIVSPRTRGFDLNLKGFAVTNPHKRGVIEFLDDVDEIARSIGAVNTVFTDGARLIGANTDAAGFMGPMLRMLGNISGARVAVVGTGGAARACIYALIEAKADVSVAGRNAAKASRLAREFGCSISSPGSYAGFDIIVNATPLGTRGEFQGQTIARAEQMNGVRLAYDLTYNPEETLFIREARKAGAATLGGLEMLVEQAVLQQRIWTEKVPDQKAMAAAARKRLTTS